MMRPDALPLLIFTLSLPIAGCEQPNRLVQYPPGALPVRYESATAHSSCLVAAVCMGARYLEPASGYTEPGMRRDLAAAGLDETRVGDLKTYLAGEGLHLVTLTGELGDKPLYGMDYWLNGRGHPVICVINLEGADAEAFNHAVVVIGISSNRSGDSPDIIHYLDPSSPEPLMRLEAPAFDELWSRGQHAMMVVTLPVGEEPREMP